jgi:hypothetical protein
METFIRGDEVLCRDRRTHRTERIAKLVGDESYVPASLAAELLVATFRVRRHHLEDAAHRELPFLSVEGRASRRQLVEHDVHEDAVLADYGPDL